MIILLATKSSHETRSRSIQLSVVLISIIAIFQCQVSIILINPCSHLDIL
ncbi:hypothetical protein NC651_027766 [Populus alba x Populus x berolinensis]|nr:hypothetical protein NC651_027766 [Populus alba x Populus x berolinensis]